jgi:acetyl-CoA carboxylase carboxyltransferase component
MKGGRGSGQHVKGSNIFDPGTSTEIGIHARHRAIRFGMDKKEIPAEGVVTGSGKANGRNIVVAA